MIDIPWMNTLFEEKEKEKQGFSAADNHALAPAYCEWWFTKQNVNARILQSSLLSICQIVTTCPLQEARKVTKRVQSRALDSSSVHWPPMSFISTIIHKHEVVAQGTEQQMRWTTYESGRWAWRRTIKTGNPVPETFLVTCVTSNSYHECVTELTGANWGDSCPEMDTSKILSKCCIFIFHNMSAVVMLIWRKIQGNKVCWVKIVSTMQLKILTSSQNIHPQDTFLCYWTALRAEVQGYLGITK